MLWAQVTLICLIVLSLFLNVKDHVKDGANPWVSLVGMVILFTLTYLAGGFSKIFH